MIVLDTHAWLWAVSAPSELSTEAAAALDGADIVGVSAFSAWEIALLAERGHVRLDSPADLWMRDALALDARFTQIPVSVPIALAAVSLRTSGLPGDPADQIIMATAEQHQAMLVTKDRQIRAFAPERTIW